MHADGLPAGELIYIHPAWQMNIVFDSIRRRV